MIETDKAWRRALGRRVAVDVATDDESLASFAVRRLGRELFERLVQPRVGGIDTADAEKLSPAAALPRRMTLRLAGPAGR